MSHFVPLQITNSIWLIHAIIRRFQFFKIALNYLHYRTRNGFFNISQHSFLEFSYPRFRNLDRKQFRRVNFKGTSNIWSIAYGNNKFVAGTLDGKMAVGEFK